MFKRFGGVPIRTICDNLKTGVSAHPREGEVVLQGDYERLGEHYHTAILPARVKKTRIKLLLKEKLELSLPVSFKIVETNYFFFFRKRVGENPFSFPT